MAGGGALWLSSRTKGRISRALFQVSCRVDRNQPLRFFSDRNSNQSSRIDLASMVMGQEGKPSKADRDSGAD